MKDELTKKYLLAPQSVIVRSANDLVWALQKKVLNNEFLLFDGRLHDWNWNSQTRTIASEELLDYFLDRNVLMTYSDCAFVHLRTDSESHEPTHLEIVIHNGALLDGHCQEKRCSFDLSGPWWTIKPIQDQIRRNFRTMAVAHVDLESETRRQRRADEIEAQMLAGTYKIVEDWQWT